MFFQRVRLRTLGESDLDSKIGIESNRIADQSDLESPKHPSNGHSLCLELIIGGITARKDGHGGARRYLEEADSAWICLEVLKATCAFWERWN